MRVRSGLCLSLLLTSAAAKFDDSGFMEWFGASLDEVTDDKLTWEGEVPSYIRGVYVQAGPGRFDMGSMRMTHAFDGFSKIHRLHFGPDGTTFSSKFLRSNFYNESVAQNTIVAATLAGSTVPPQGFGPKGALDGANDNNDVKCHKVGGQEMVLSDTPVVSVFSGNFARLDHVIRPTLFALGTPGKPWDDSIEPFLHICASGVMAHGKTNPITGRFTGASGCISPLEDTPLHWDYHLVFEIDPARPDRRELLAKIALPMGRKASYMHTMAHTENHIVLIAQPLHMSVTGVMEGKSLSEGTIVLGNGTIFQIVDRKDGSVREIHHPSFLTAHIANAWEDDGDIFMDLTWYEADWRMMFLGMFQFKNLQKEVRDTWPANRFVRFRLRKDGLVEEQNLLPSEAVSSWEVPKMDERLAGKKHCVVWLLQMKSNAYDEEWNSTEVGPSGAYGMAKRNLCTGERRGFYAPNEYPGEVEFIPNPDSTEEDNGALVGMVFDANRNSSYVQILDARTMKRIARADLNIRVPFNVHASFYPEGTPEEPILI